MSSGMTSTATSDIPSYCNTCGESFKPKQVLRFKCGCEYCAACLESLFSQAMADDTGSNIDYYVKLSGNTVAPRCCQGLVPFDKARRLLSEPLAKAYAAKRIELETRHRTYCHVQSCRHFIMPYSIHNNRGFCRKCKAITCTKCDEKDHFGPCGKAADEEVLTLANQEGWFRCPHCKNVVERVGGCDSM